MPERDIHVPEKLEFPTDRAVHHLDVRNLGPPEPLRKTLETLSTTDSVVLQINDRAPKFLYPKLEDRGFEYETVETDDAVLTAIWKP
jgi:hypothetical protein